MLTCIHCRREIPDDEPTRFVAVLEISPADSAQKNLQVQIVKGAKRIK
jgi:hypothetical protein